MTHITTRKHFVDKRLGLFAATSTVPGPFGATTAAVSPAATAGREALASGRFEVHRNARAAARLDSV